MWIASSVEPVWVLPRESGNIAFVFLALFLTGIWQSFPWEQSPPRIGLPFLFLISRFFCFCFEFVFLSRDRTVVPMMGSVVPASGTPVFVFVFSHFLYCSAHETDPTTADAQVSSQLKLLIVCGDF